MYRSDTGLFCSVLPVKSITAKWAVKVYHLALKPSPWLNCQMDGIWFLFPLMDLKHLEPSTVTHTCTAASILCFHPTECPTFWVMPGLRSNSKAKAHLCFTCPQSPLNTRRPETQSLLFQSHTQIKSVLKDSMPAQKREKKKPHWSVRAFTQFCCLFFIFCYGIIL